MAKWNAVTARIKSVSITPTVSSPSPILVRSSLRTKIAALPTPARWAVYEVCIFVFLFMGRFLGGGSFLYARY